MTKQVKYPVTCLKCGHRIERCPKCDVKVERFSPFSNWLRRLPHPFSSRQVSNQNLDYIWFNYRERWFITIEEKMYGGRPDLAQWDTHNAVRQMLELSSGQSIVTLLGEGRVHYGGHFIISFEQTYPCDSAWIDVWHGRGIFYIPYSELRFTRIDGLALLYLLRTGRLVTGVGWADIAATMDDGVLIEAPSADAVRERLEGYL